MLPDSQRPISLSWLLGSAVLSLLIVGACTAALYPLEQVLHDPVVALLYLLPVIVSTLYLGLWGGIVAAGAAFLAFNYFFIEPYFTLFVRHIQDFFELLIFLGVAVFTSQTMGRTRIALVAATESEKQAIRLHELTNTLARLHDSQSIVDALATQCQQIVRAQQVSVSVDVDPDDGPQVVYYPKKVSFDARPPTLVLPLESKRGLLGEIALWRLTPFSLADERILRTFAGQGALAIERARLLQNETRTRILEESEQLKAALLNSVSHELRTPLATIKASVSSLRSGVVDWDADAPARLELLQAIEEETDSLNLLVGNILNMSRLEAGALHLQRSWNLLSEIVESVSARIRRTTSQVDIQSRFPADLPLVPVDYALMEQVFANLIGNGLKYAANEQPIWIEAGSRSKWVWVSVCNSGPSVPEELLERIFDKFYRAASANDLPGTGLGLSICKGIVEAHGGRIWAENRPDGIAFCFDLPLVVAGLPLPKPVEIE